MLESIYSEDQVIKEPARELESDSECVESTFKLQPNTGFNEAKVGVVIYAKFTFPKTVIQFLPSITKLLCFLP